MRSRKSVRLINRQVSARLQFRRDSSFGETRVSARHTQSGIIRSTDLLVCVFTSICTQTDGSGNESQSSPGSTLASADTCPLTWSWAFAKEQADVDGTWRKLQLDPKRAVDTASMPPMLVSVADGYRVQGGDQMAAHMQATTVHLQLKLLFLLVAGCTQQLVR
jgi:hypothetical protein